MYLDQLDLESTYSLEDVANLLGLKLKFIVSAVKSGELEAEWLIDRQIISQRQLGDFLIARLKKHRAMKPKVIKSRNKSRTY